MKRRKLKFTALEQVAVDVDLLHRAGYGRVGNWTLAQVCDHLTKFMVMSLDGFPVKMPWPIRAVMGPYFLKPLTLWSEWIPAGVQGPAVMMPTAPPGEAQAVERCKQALLRVQEFAGSFHPSPLFGEMTPGQWRKIHLIHAAHHLSFLLPLGPVEATGAPNDS